MRRIFRNKHAVGSVIESAVGLTCAIMIITVILSTISDPFSQETMISEKKLDSMAAEIADLLLSRTGEDTSGLSDWERHIISLDQDDGNSVSSIGLAPNPSELSFDNADFTTFSISSSEGNNAPGNPILTGPDVVLIDSIMEMEPGVEPLDDGQSYGYEYTAVSTDIDDDLLMYEFDWGDGQPTYIPNNYYNSGENCTVLHSWGNTAYTYLVKVRAIDIHGATSGWTSMTVQVVEDPDDPLWGIPTPIPICCFPAGTLITMADGTTKEIEKIVPGDLVLSYDFEKGITIETTVMNVIVKHREGVYDINGGLVSPTDDHPLYVRKSDGVIGWAAVNPEKAKLAYPNRDSMKLEVGDELFTSDGWVEIESIEFREGPIKTYTFTVDNDCHNYFANGVLASNTNLGQCGSEAMNPVNPDGPDRDQTEDQMVYCCLPAGTKVSMSDGVYKNIEDIKIGDQVISYDIEHNDFAISKVTHLITKLREGVYDINGGLVSPTDDHPLYVRKSNGTLGWASVNPEKSLEAYREKDPMKLEVGDELFTSNGWVKIESIEFREGAIRTYTFTVDKSYHNYLANDVLVSNWGNEGDCGGWVHCFDKGTKIVMADEGLKNIEDVEPGDMIKAFDEQNGSYVDDEVIGVFHDTPEEMNNDYYLRINEKLDVTTEHMLYINGEWIRAGDLEIGDIFTDKSNVESIEKIMERIPTFNLDSKTYNNFVISIGKDEFIVAHNDETYAGSAEDAASNNYVLDGYSEEMTDDSQTTSVSKEIIRQKYLIDDDKVEALSLKADDVSFYNSILKPSLNLDSNVEISIRVSDDSQTLLNYQPYGSPSDARLVSSQQRTALSYSPSTQTFGDIVTLEVVLYQY